ncbi:hypothetical protein RND81_02G219500 [Saponaria officinalis]|uniref:Glucose-methanol-choline oxidoreductase N-terminal domain-containing protein n=1 Tax=Saponaria officinalis TaxID=3572 RepID=A0AAW1MZI6_SAPOF
MEFQQTKLRFLTTTLLSFIYLCSSSTKSTSCDKEFEAQLPYMTSNVTEIKGKSFDYIIIGGGASGCALAATLSEKFSVLLIERGGSPYKDPTILERTKFGLPLIQTNKFTSVAQVFKSADGIVNYRGRVLGGSTAINSGFYSRASCEFVKKMNWDENLVKQAYEWVESKLVFPPFLSPWQSIVLDGLLEAGVLPFNGYTLEHVQGTKLSGTLFDVFGKRHTSADLLVAGNVNNIVVLLNATASKIMFHKNGKKPRAYGVKFIKSEGSTKETYKVYLKKDNSSTKGEVILSAGALSSPQLLMLSGIGPKNVLQKFNIPIISNIEQVGFKMQDNPSISLLVDTKPKWRVPDTPQVTGITDNYTVIIESIIVPVTHNLSRVSIAGKVANPKSQGMLELNNDDPRENPLVKFNYLTEKEDMDACIRIRELVGRVSMSRWVGVYLGEEHNEYRKLGEEESREYCRKNVGTFYHYHGGCVVGLVVDEGYKVKGVKGLRVVDGSTLVESPGTNPMATLMMLGRYQGLKIIENRIGSLL